MHIGKWLTKVGFDYFEKSESKKTLGLHFWRKERARIVEINFFDDFHDELLVKDCLMDRVL